MKTSGFKRTIFILVAAVIVIFATFWAFRDRRQAESGIDKAGGAGTHADEAEKQISPSSQTQQNTEAGPTRNEADSREEVLQEIVGSKNTRIDFYGKVVDQNREPLSGVAIKLTVRRWHVRPPLSADATFNEHTLETDSSGLFRLEGERGDGISIKSIEKAGYELSQRASTSFAYTGPQQFSSDPRHPVVFHMWKKSGAEPLHTMNKFFGISPDGREYVIDLMTGEKVENGRGDIRVRINRPAGVSRRDKYDWSFIVEAIDGGIQESDDEFMFRAPEVGYDPKCSFEFNGSDPNWSRVVKKRFYVKTRGGLFGRIEVQVFGFYDNEAALDVKSAINPSGSTNLEFDPSVQPKKDVYE